MPNQQPNKQQNNPAERPPSAEIRAIADVVQNFESTLLNRLGEFGGRFDEMEARLERMNQVINLLSELTGVPLNEADANKDGGSGGNANNKPPGNA